MIAIWMAWACAESPVEEAFEPEANGAPVALPAARPEDAVGVVVAPRDATVSAEVGGVLVTVRHDIGSLVSAGDPLGTIEPASRGAEVQAVSRELEAAQVAEADARAVEDAALRRAVAERGLRAEGATSTDALADAELAVSRAHASVERATAVVRATEARLGGLQAELERRHLRAPFAGRIAQWLRAPGEHVAVGDRVVRVVGEGVPWVRFAVVPRVASLLAPGSVVEVRAEGGDELGMAEVVRVAPEVDAASQLVFVEARLAEHTAAVPGQDAWVRIP